MKSSGKATARQRNASCQKREVEKKDDEYIFLARESREVELTLLSDDVFVTLYAAKSCAVLRHDICHHFHRLFAFNLVRALMHSVTRPNLHVSDIRHTTISAQGLACRVLTKELEDAARQFLATHRCRAPAWLRPRRGR
nr:hypothetical protein CFP56_11699 [Quercus suber]